MPRERLRAVLHAGSLDLARLAADGGSIGAVQHAAVTHWPREEDCAALCRMEARTTERVPLTNTSHNTVSWLCLAFIWHAAPSNEGGGKCFLVGTPGSRGRSRAKRRRPPRPIPRPPLVPDAPPPPPMVPCAELLASTRTSGSTSASASTNASTSASASTNASRPSSASGPARRFVLVTSTARVGSNWVRSLLNQHPQLHMEGERLSLLTLTLALTLTLTLTLTVTVTVTLTLILNLTLTQGELLSLPTYRKQPFAFPFALDAALDAAVAHADAQARSP